MTTITATTPITEQIAQARQVMQDMITLGFGIAACERQERRINALKAKLANTETKETPVASTEDRIIAAISERVAQPRDSVSLAQIRAELADVDRARLDRTLRAMDRAGVVCLVPDPNRKALTDLAKDAAIEIGGQDMHLVSLA